MHNFYQLQKNPRANDNGKSDYSSSMSGEEDSLKNLIKKLKNKNSKKTDRVLKKQ